MKIILNLKAVLITSIVLIGPLVSYSQYTHRFMTRGADTAEFYLCCQWYADADHITWNGIFHSIDNGQSLSVQRKMNRLVEGGLLFGDDSAGVIYQIPMSGQDTFGVSYNYGVTFEKKYFNDIWFETAGCTAGELYLGSFGIYRSGDYGSSFTFQSNYDSIRLEEVGTEPGELFCKKASENPDSLQLAYSSDFGQTFSINMLRFPDPTPSFLDLDFYRGTEPGEIYFVGWKNLDTIALYHSFNYGDSISLQSYFLETNDQVFYTAGRTPGSFYFVQRRICGTPPSLHSCLWIYFSRDYGATFTTYFHDLDSTYTSSPVIQDPYNISVYPNPASDFLTIDVNPGSPGATIELVNILGDVILRTKMKINDNRQTLDVSDLPKGLYLVQVTPVAGSCKTIKVVIE